MHLLSRICCLAKSRLPDEEELRWGETMGSTRNHPDATFRFSFHGPPGGGSEDSGKEKEGHRVGICWREQQIYIMSWVVHNTSTVK